MNVVMRKHGGKTKTFASDFLENHEDIFPVYQKEMYNGTLPCTMDSFSYRYTQWIVFRNTWTMCKQFAVSRVLELTL